MALVVFLQEDEDVPRVYRNPMAGKRDNPQEKYTDIFRTDSLSSTC